MSDQSAQTPENGMQIDPGYYMKALEQQNADLLREKTMLIAALQQTRDELLLARNAVDEVSASISKPKHNGRTTTKKEKKGA